MDRFTTPEPSAEALRAYDKADGGDGIISAWERRCLTAAYAVDMERIVREELSHLHGFLATYFRHHSAEARSEVDAAFAEYRTARFGNDGQTDQDMEAAFQAALGKLYAETYWVSMAPELQETMRFLLRAALPHLRRMHFQEAATTLEQGAGPDTRDQHRRGWVDAASFLRGLAESSEGR